VIDEIAAWRQTGTSLTERAMILQSGIGTGNQASDDEMGSGNASLIEQIGERNRADVLQRVGGNDSLIHQIGSDNIASVSQTGPSGNFAAAITQTGNNNRAGISQR
jgi:hypothetical protein